MPALPHGEVAGAVEAVKASSAWVGTKLCFEFMVLTAVRPGEARGARWEEIDFGGSVWTIPATRMKSTREHRVPLCGRAVEILHAAARLRRGSTTAPPGRLVFPSARGKQLADARLSKLLEQLGVGAVPHGFRSSFRDWASERTDHPRKVIEAALAHVVRNQTEAAYARSDLFDRRRQLMDDWMQYLDPERSPPTYRCVTSGGRMCTRCSSAVRMAPCGSSVSFDDVIPAPKKPHSLPVVLNPQEVVQFLEAVEPAKHRAILTACYAAGQRISEVIAITVSAIDSERMVLRITKGKGQKNRYVTLSPKLLAVLRAWWKVQRPRHWLFPGERPEAPAPTPSRHATLTSSHHP